MHAHVACMRMRQGTLEQKHWTRQCTAGRLQAKVHSHVSEIPELETARPVWIFQLTPKPVLLLHH